MPLDLFYTMVQKSRKWPKTQIKGGGPALISVKPLTTENTKNKATSKICKITVFYNILRGSVERSRPERHFCSLLPYFLLS